MEAKDLPGSTETSNSCPLPSVNAPPIKLRSLGGEYLQVDLAGVVNVRDLRESVVEATNSLPSEVKLLCGDVEWRHDGLAIADILSSLQEVELQVVITGPSEEQVEEDFARVAGSVSMASMKDTTQLNCPIRHTPCDCMMDMRHGPDTFVQPEKLSRLPNSIIEMTSLRELNLEGHNLRHLPQRIGELTQLKKVDVQSNELHKLPESIGCLLDLEKFDASTNKLDRLPESFGSLTKLKTTDLRANRISCLPLSFGNLMALEVLYLNANQLLTLPESFGNLTSLRVLWLLGNGLQALPSTFPNLISLAELNLGLNSLEGLPENFGMLSNLQSLNLRGNPLQVLPNGFENLLLSQYGFQFDLNKVSPDMLPDFIEHLPLRCRPMDVGLKAPEVKVSWFCCRRRGNNLTEIKNEPKEKNTVVSAGDMAEDEAIFELAKQKAMKKQNFCGVVPDAKVTPQ